MHQSYQMAFVNLLLITLLLIGIFIYSKILKKKINLFILLNIITILPLIHIFRPGLYESGDFAIHIYRSISFFHSLLEGNILPSWAGELNATYGYPLFIFNYPLPYYITSLFHILGLSFISSLKVFLAVNLYLSAIGMYIFMNKQLENKLAAFTSAIFYTFAPYHLIDIHFKNVIGEIMFFTLLPYTFYFFSFIQSQKSIRYLFASSLFFSLLIMSHVVLALFSLPLLFGYSLMQISKRKPFVYILKICAVFLIGSLSSIYIWLTPFFMSKYTLFSAYQTNHVLSIPFKDLLFSPWRFGILFQGPHGEISNLIGYTQIFVLLTSIFTIILKRTDINKNNYAFWIIMTILFICLITPLADIVWFTVPFIRNVGNHRLLILVVFSISILSGYISISYKSHKLFLCILIGITIFYTFLNWGHRKTLTTVNDTDLISNLPISTSQTEGHFYANSVWQDKNHPWYNTLPESHLVASTPHVNIQEISRTSVFHEYIVSTQEKTTFTENTLYFPGWNVIVNGKPVPIEYKNNALINFTLPGGVYRIEAKYKDISIYYILKLVSFCCTMLVIICLILSLRLNFFRNNK